MLQVSPAVIFESAARPALVPAVQFQLWFRAKAAA